MKIATLSRKASLADKPLNLHWKVIDGMCDDIIERARERQRHKKFISKTTGRYIYYKYREPIYSSKGISVRTNVICNLGEASNEIRSISHRANIDRRQGYGYYR